MGLRDKSQRDAGMPRPVSTWMYFLEAAPYFSSALWYADPETSDFDSFAVLPRAFLYYDRFDGEIGNGGILQYFFNNPSDMEDFTQLTEIVVLHPILADAGALMREALPLLGEFRTRIEDAREAADESSERDEFMEAATSLFESKNSSVEEFDRRWNELNRQKRLEVERHVLTNVEAYFDFEPLKDMSGAGIENIDAVGRHGVCHLRFVDGFPIGPNIFEHDRFPGEVKIVRFTSDRMHVEYDASGPRKNQRRRSWVDFRTGLSSSRFFTNGQLDSVSGRLNLAESHGLSQRFSESGETTYTSFGFRGDKVYYRSETHGIIDVTVRDFSHEIVAQHHFVRDQDRE